MGCFKPVDGKDLNYTELPLSRAGPFSAGTSRAGRTEGL